MPKISRASSRDEGSTIHAVELETGIAATTLRDWERRFGFPAPARRPGTDRRVYAASDVARLKLVRRALAHGYRIGDVIEKSDEALLRLGAGPLSAEDGAAVGEVSQLVRLLASDDADAFAAHVRHAAVTYGARRFLTELAHPLTIEIGRAWAEGQLSVRHEHFATEVLTSALHQLFAFVQPVANRPVVLLTTLPDEPYTLPVLFVALFLSAAGATVRLLGPRTPRDEIVAAARALRVDVVGVSVSAAVEPGRMSRAVRALGAALPRGVALWVGGAGAERLRLPPRVAATLTSWDSMGRAVEAQRCGNRRIHAFAAEGRAS